ncbi:FtsQ-type POTRA domain-containing protein [Devosia sp. XJ19-1]|uniref:Cell division protein FtsQ n=1 Tax=Devosia ureilytica TaxID=2952754 RepID=A0A9Q4FSV7_9HYPH|nr:FtsQ-type POTRA domain-containing protein [Devosia ureilytica]MCP8883636.1 FtsQ-type POTRA domain-containing protein [Devosia ureilytica]MCP8887244.1 FtsQ-type POTRA domain-containing protein [Devosia ureilytica]
MQQVKSETFLAGARLVDPRALPVPVRTSRQRLTNRFNRAVVLHGRAIRRGVMIAAVLATGLVLYQVREPIGMLANTIGGIAQGNFAQAGLAIGEIEISGQTLTSEQQIFDALGIQPHTSTLAFDVEAARLRIAELPAVDSVTVGKTYPGDVSVVITEKTPVARWAVDGITFLIDGRGDQIGEAGGAYAELPLVIGDGAADDALVMIRALDGFPLLQDGLVALSRIADRRWDLIYDTGLRVQLPEQGVAQAMAHLVTYQNDYQLLDRDVSTIDLRIDSVVAVRPNPTDEDAEQS